MRTTRSTVASAGTASGAMPTAELVTVTDSSLTTQQAMDALVAASTSTADASAVASEATAVLPAIPEDVSHPNAAMLVRVSQWLLLNEFIYSMSSTCV